MADNLTTQSATPATVPAASVVATDDVAGAHYQRVKLTDGTPDGTAHATVTATGALSVDPREQVAEVPLASAGLTVSATTYVSGDVLGSELTLAGMARANGGHCSIVGAVLVDKSNIIGAVDLYLFNAASTPAVDNAANAWADADMANLLGIVHFGDVVQSANNRAALGVNLPVTLKCGGATTSVYGVLVTRAAHAFFVAATDLVGRLEVAQH